MEETKFPRNFLMRLKILRIYNSEKMMRNATLLPFSMIIERLLELS